MTVLWGARRGDIQVNSIEDWRRQVRLAREWRMQQRYAGIAASMRRLTIAMGTDVKRAVSGFRSLEAQRALYERQHGWPGG